MIAGFSAVGIVVDDKIPFSEKPQKWRRMKGIMNNGRSRSMKQHHGRIRQPYGVTTVSFM